MDPITRREFIERSSKVAAAGAALSGRRARGAATAESTIVSGNDVVSDGGAVAAPERAARVGAEILQRGGNAMDAAAAACLACGVMHPHLVCVGGYVASGVVLEGTTGKIWSLDGNSTAPALARENMFQVTPLSRPVRGLNETEYRCHVAEDANVNGPLAVGVPGFIGGIGMLSERWGRLKWPEIVSPSLALLAQGFDFGSSADAIKFKQAVIRKFEPSVKHLMPHGKLPSASDRWHRPDMEKTLARLSSAGWRDFYEGELGRTIADYVLSIGGILSREDMAAFRPLVEQPYAITFRKAKVYGAALSNGGLTALQALNMLECFEPVSDQDPLYWHRLAEILKLAWRDRFQYLGDPKFGKVPVKKLLSQEYASGQIQNLRKNPNYVDRSAPPSPQVSPQGTVHVSAADVEGNLVAMTISQGGWLGSCVTVPDTGIVLGHGICRFDPHPGGPNSIQPRKRPLNNICPMITRSREQEVAVGLAGGRRIVSVSTQIVQRLLDQNAMLLQAVRAPRMHIEAGEPIEMEETVDSALRSRLTDMGHEIVSFKQVGNAAQVAEFRKSERMVRAAGNAGAAGVSNSTVPRSVRSRRAR